LAEDNKINQKVVCGLLRPRHHVVEVVDNGADAVKAVECGVYDLVLMDLQMPIMGGLEATRAIRARDAECGWHTRIVALTAHAMKTDRDQCMAAGMDGYLAKPVNRRALLAVVEQNAAGVDAPDADGLDFTSIRARVGGDEELLASLVERVLEECPDLLAKIAQSVSERDARQLRLSAHTLHGLAAQFSAAAVVRAAAVLEDAAVGESIEWNAVDAEAARLRQHVDQLVVWVRNAAPASAMTSVLTARIKDEVSIARKL
jgi:CheY-like chemotaxis protein